MRPSRPRPLFEDLPCPPGAAPVQAPPGGDLPPGPHPAGSLSLPKPTPHPTGGAGAELSATAYPPSRRHPGQDVVTAKEGQEVGCRHVWAGDLWGLCGDKASNIGRWQDGGPGPRAPRSRGGSGLELPGLQTPRGTLEAQGSAAQPQSTQTGRGSTAGSRLPSGLMPAPAVDVPWAPCPPGLHASSPQVPCSLEPQVRVT